MLKKDIAVTFGGQVATVLFGMVGAALLARALGPDGRGVFALAVLVPRTVSILFQFGQPSVNNVFAGLYRDQRPALFGQTMLFGLVFGLLSVLAMIAWYFWLPVNRGSFGELSTGLILLAIAIAPLEMFRDMLQTLARGSEMIVSTAIISTAGMLLFALSVLIFLTCFGYGVTTALWITIGVAVARIIGHLWQVRGFATLDPRRLDWPIMKHSLRYGGVRTLSTIALYLIARIAMFMFGYLMLSDAEIGLYAVALLVSDQLKIIPGSVAQAFLPRLSNDPGQRLKHTPAVYRYTVIASWATGLGLALVGPPVIYLLFGREYIGSIVPLLLMLPGLAIFGGNRVLGMDLLVRDKPHYTMINNWIAFIVTGLASLLLIPAWGINGAAVGNTLGFLCLSGTTIIAYKKASGVKLKELMLTVEDFKVMRGHALEAYHKTISKLRGTAAA